MRPFRGALFLGALVLLMATSASVEAAWNNVFQVCCHRDQGSISNFAPGCDDPCPQPCPQPVCTTRYVQRCYYQPVTTYKTRTYYEPVTTYRRSSYWEPVTSYRYSCCYDPCTCSYRQVATPVTCYRLRTRCNAVTSYLRRCQLVPVTSYRQVTYYQAVTDCCDPCPSSSAAPSTAQPPVAGPRVGEERSNQKPRVGEQRFPDGNGTSRFPDARDGGNAGGSSYRSAPPKRPTVKLDRIVALPGHNVEGRVVNGSRYVRPRARILFVSLEKQNEQKRITADDRGRFQTHLASGQWLVYVRDDSGRPIYQKKISVEPDIVRQVSLLTR